MEATHVIVSENLKETIREFQKDETYPNTDIIVMIINEESENGYEIELTKTEFKKFSKYRSDYFNDLKGHLTFNEQPILIFGTLHKDLLLEKGSITKKILGEKYSMNKQAPPLNYEPSFTTFYVEKQ